MKPKMEHKASFSSIETYFAYIKNSVEPIIARRKEMEKLLAECKKNQDTTLDDNYREFLYEVIERYSSTIRGIRNFEKELDIEIERVSVAVAALHSDDALILKNAFTSFVLTDTSFSVKNIGMALYDYDEIINAMREINKDPSVE